MALLKQSTSGGSTTTNKNNTNLFSNLKSTTNNQLKKSVSESTSELKSPTKLLMTNTLEPKNNSSFSITNTLEPSNYSRTAPLGAYKSLGKASFDTNSSGVSNYGNKKTNSNFSNLANSILSNANKQTTTPSTTSSSGGTGVMSNWKDLVKSETTNPNFMPLVNKVSYMANNKQTDYRSGGTKENPAGQERMIYGVNSPVETNSQGWLKELLADNEGNDPSYVGGGSGGGSSSSYYDDLMAAFMEQNEAARQAALEAILQNLNAVKGTYKNQIEKVINDYNALVDENEVKKDRARRVIRENQANRGQLDSGMGRQEQLDMNIGYDNATTQLKSAREQAVNEIYNLIAQAEAEANTNRANVNNTYNNALLEYQMAVRS